MCLQYRICFYTYNVQYVVVELLIIILSSGNCRSSRNTKLLSRNFCKLQVHLSPDPCGATTSCMKTRISYCTCRFINHRLLHDSRVTGPSPPNALSNSRLLRVTFPQLLERRVGHIAMMVSVCVYTYIYICVYVYIYMYIYIR